MTEIPEHLKSGLERYRDHHIETGSFLRCMLDGDHTAAAGRADPVSKAHMTNIAIWITENLPSNSYGSLEKVAAWLTPARACARCGCVDDKACVAERDDVNRSIEAGSPCWWITDESEAEQVCSHCGTATEVQAFIGARA